MAGTIWKNMIPGQHVPGEYDYVKIFSGIPYSTDLITAQYNDVAEDYGYNQKIISIIAICIAVLTCCFTIPMKSFGLEAYNEKQDDDIAKSNQASDIKKTQPSDVKDVNNKNDRTNNDKGTSSDVSDESGNNPV